MIYNLKAAAGYRILWVAPRLKVIMEPEGYRRIQYFWKIPSGNI